MSIMDSIFIYSSERSSVPKRSSRESYRKSYDSGREPRVHDSIVRESAMTFACHSCKKPGHKLKDNEQLMEK